MEHTRRNFLKKAGLALLTVQMFPITRAVADHRKDSQFVVNSEISSFVPLPGHWHELILPMNIFENPPIEGVELDTEWAYLHYHSVKLTQKDLTLIAAGDSVTVEDTVGDHKFTIQFPKES